MKRNKVPPEVMEQARAMVEDGASVQEITRTTGLARETVVKHFPGSSWTHQEAGAFGWMIKNVDYRIGKNL